MSRNHFYSEALLHHLTEKNKIIISIIIEIIMDFYLYTCIIRIGTQLIYIFHHIKIPTIISNIGFMIVHTGPCNTKNTS